MTDAKTQLEQINSRLLGLFKFERHYSLQGTFGSRHMQRDHVTGRGRLEANLLIDKLDRFPPGVDENFDVAARITTRVTNRGGVDAATACAR